MKFIRRWIENIIDYRIKDTVFEAKQAQAYAMKLRGEYEFFRRTIEDIFDKTKLHKICENGSITWFDYEAANKEFSRIDAVVYDLDKKLRNHIKRGKK